MYVSRGDLSPEQVSAKRNRELEAAPAVPQVRKTDKGQGVPWAEDARIPVDRQNLRLAQNALSRAQGLLAGLEQFRSALARTGEQGDQRAALQVLARSRYRGEAVLEPHRQLLQRAAAARDPSILDRLIGTVRQNIAALARDREAGSGLAAPRKLSALFEGIRRNGPGLERLERDNVLRLLS
jgi:hypothetical protein